MSMKTLISRVLVVAFTLSFLNTSILADQLDFNFKNPAFSGNGYSNHVLSVDQLQSQRKKDNEAEAKSAAAFADFDSASLSFFLCDCNWSTDKTC